MALFEYTTEDGYYYSSHYSYDDYDATVGEPYVTYGYMAAFGVLGAWLLLQFIIHGGIIKRTKGDPKTILESFIMSALIFISIHLLPLIFASMDGKDVGAELHSTAIIVVVIELIVAAIVVTAIIRKIRK